MSIFTDYQQFTKTKLCSRYLKRDLLVIWDGVAIHRSQTVKAFLSRRAGRVHLERLPAYSPDRIAEATESGRVALEPSKTQPKESGFTTLDQL